MGGEVKESELYIGDKNVDDVVVRQLRAAEAEATGQLEGWY